MICLQLAGRRESLLEKLTVLSLSSRTLCFMPLVWELTRGSCSSAWATMNCICGAGSPTPLRCSRWKPRPARRSTRKNWKGERDCGERGRGGRDKWHQTAGVQQAVVPAGQQPVRGLCLGGVWAIPCSQGLCVAPELWLTGQQDCVTPVAPACGLIFWVAREVCKQRCSRLLCGGAQLERGSPGSWVLEPGLCVRPWDGWV